MGRVTERAEVEGVEFTKKEEETALDEILQATTEFELNQEIARQVRGVFDPTGIYNIPRHSNTPGTLKSYPECDRIAGGCPYKGQPHIHIIGVGIQGAYNAMRAYGKMKVHVEQPVIVNMDNVSMWCVEVKATDGHNGNELNRFYFQSTQKKLNNQYMVDPEAPHIAQSKCIRNVVLAVIAGGIFAGWVDDYKHGKQPFSTERVKEYEKSQSQPRTPAKAKAEKSKIVEKQTEVVPPPAMDLASEDISEPVSESVVIDEWQLALASYSTIEGLQAKMLANKAVINNSPFKAGIVKLFTARKNDILNESPQSEEPEPVLDGELFGEPQQGEE